MQLNMAIHHAWSCCWALVLRWPKLMRWVRGSRLWVHPLSSPPLPTATCLGITTCLQTTQTLYTCMQQLQACPE